MSPIRFLARSLAIAVIRCYQYLLSPWLGTRCRFEPGCSHYAEQAIRLHGTGKGSWLAVKRLLRCHPFGTSGIDPVPPVQPKQ